MADETGAPRDMHSLVTDALLADLIGGRALTLGGEEELRAVLRQCPPSARPVSTRTRTR